MKAEQERLRQLERDAGEKGKWEPKYKTLFTEHGELQARAETNTRNDQAMISRLEKEIALLKTKMYETQGALKKKEEENQKVFIFDCDSRPLCVHVY